MYVRFGKLSKAFTNIVLQKEHPLFVVDIDVASMKLYVPQEHHCEQLAVREVLSQSAPWTALLPSDRPPPAIRSEIGKQMYEQKHIKAWSCPNANLVACYVIIERSAVST
jgi:hypothetical protein